MTKEELQNKAIKDLKEKKRVILAWPTSLGKGYVGAKIIADTILNKPSHKRVLLVVAETLHKENWREEFIKQGFDSLYDRITVECYASLKNYTNTNWDLIVFDEMHHLFTENKFDILLSINSERVLGLSATIPMILVNTIASKFGEFVVSRVSLNEAFENGWLPEPKIYLIPLTFNINKNNQVYIKEWGRKKKRKEISCNFSERWTYLKNRQLYPDVKLCISCNEWQKYLLISEEISYLQKVAFMTRNQARKNIWMQACSQRKKYLGELKTDIARKFLSKFEDKRYICFCTNIEQAESLNFVNCIHSQKNNNQEIVNNFNNGDINSLFAIGMAQEGMNLTDIEAEIMIQLDGSERAIIQKWGRALRAYKPEIYIFYYPQTRDEEYLKKAIEGINKEYLETLDINKI